MTPPVQIIGSYLSPYVRKVLVVLDQKAIPYEIDPLIPFYGDERFSALSPLRRIPVLIDDRVRLADSTVICEYLEDRYPTPSMFPREPERRARARWLEEFADTRLGDVIIWRLYHQLVIRRFVWGQAPDQPVLDKARNEEIPSALDHLETELPAEGFLFGDALSVADVSIASFFRNAAFARYAIDAARWPRTAAFVDRVLGLDSFRRLRPFEEKSLRTPIPQHREALGAIGAPLSAETYVTATPRPSLMID